MSTRLAPRGFTLLEMVIAIFVFSVGALGLAATSAVITRSLATTALRERAGRIAAARLETLRAEPCAGAGSGSENLGGLMSVWTVTRANGFVEVTERASYSIGGASHTLAYEAVIPCAE